MKKSRYRWTRNSSTPGQSSAIAIPGQLEISESGKATNKLVRDSKPHEFRVSRFSLVRKSNDEKKKGNSTRSLTWHRPKTEEEVAQTEVVRKPVAEQQSHRLEQGRSVGLVTGSSQTAKRGRSRTWVRRTGTPLSSKKTTGKVLGNSVGRAVSASRWISWDHRNRKKASMVWKNPDGKDNILSHCPESDSSRMSAELTPELSRGHLGEKSPIIRASVASPLVCIRREQRKSLENNPTNAKNQDRPPRVKQSKGCRVLKILDIGGKMYQSTSKPGSKSLNLNPSIPPKRAPQAASVNKNPLQIRKKSVVTDLRRTRSQGRQGGAQGTKTRKSMHQEKYKYCPIYCHTGICPKRKKGCKFVHDPTKRAICTKWLTGVCKKGLQCPLQHQMKRELMPACVHYLQGKCNKVDCPWLHQNIDKEAPVCQAFIRGYCPAGESCASKHYTIRQVKEEKRLRLPVHSKARHTAREGQMKFFKRKRYFENPMADFCSITDGTPTEAEAAVEIQKMEEDSLAQGNSIPDYIDL